MTTPMNELRIFPNGQVEVGTGEPGYCWVQAYSQRSENGVSQPLRLSDWRAMAKRDGQKLVVCANEEEAKR